MSLLIDGYNLLHASGIVGRGLGPGGLERSRLALLNFVAEAVDTRDLAHTIVVFDAANAPPGLPRSIMHRGLTVRFAAQYESADELIEELIRADSSPRRLTVVSSDHRLHRAARRRHARPIDSDRWYADMLRRRQGQGDMPQPSKPSGSTSDDIEFWLQQFGGDAPPNDEIFPPGYGEGES
ncbi:MAG TPA: NYN domain-containing protein [Pirellulales bacterium]|nr:NYN domain-containing protein [Pirellulales bacterium]